MNAYIWQNATDITDRYHSGGGVLIIAPTLERAREVFLRDGTLPGNEFGPGFVPSESNVLTTDPDVFYRIEATDERLFLFPNAGCC